MRLWPFRPRSRYVISATPPEDLLALEDLLRRNVEDILVVRERQLRGLSVVFGGELLVSPPRALALLEERFKPYGYTPFLREEGGKVWVQALPLAEVEAPARVTWNVVLFLLTCLSTLLAGTGFAGSPTFDDFRRFAFPTWMLSGVPFAVTLLGILGVHEFGHYFTARHYRASVSLPYFIPLPFGWGTLGAIILMRSPVRNRDASFDIAAAGPLAGLAVALPAMLLGLGWSRVAPIPPGGYAVFGDSLLTSLLTWVQLGPIPDGSMVYT